MPGVAGEVPVPGTANGYQPGDLWRFRAKKGQPVIVDVEASRLGSDLDSWIEILDEEGNLLPRATLRSVARTFVTFRDHDARGANIRVEAWNELEINDYIYTGGQLLRIKAMPTHPDSDMIFFSRKGWRIGYLGTTPTHLPKGTPMYKVEIHPPEAQFPPNGFPVFRIPYANDDGGPGWGKDSHLWFDPPRDGIYHVRIQDARNRQASPNDLRFAYRLTIRPPEPSFTVQFDPQKPKVWRGGAVPITVTADRIDGFDGPISIRLEGLPSGLSAPATTIPAGEWTTAFALYADEKARTSPETGPIRLIATAQIGGREVTRRVTGGKPNIVDPGDIVTTTSTSEVRLVAGGEARLTVTIQRRNGFKGRVPLEVRGLPHGVKVKDIGLNGILINENETTRTFVLYAAPWVPPQDQPIVVLARREGKNTLHAARSVLLHVVQSKAAVK